MTRLTQIHPRGLVHPDNRQAAAVVDVLVVDDDAMIRSYVADVLVDEGYRVGTAQDGAVALQMLEAYQQQGLPQPAVILLDMRMPVMDGWAFSRAYRALPVEHAPIVVVTAAHDAEKRAEQVRAADVLSKPFELDDLIDVVARQAGRRAG